MIEGGLKNPELNHPKQGNSVPNFAMILGAVAVDLLLLFYRALDPEKRWFGINAMIREMAWSYALASFITNSAKNYVGRPRPNFFELCEYDGSGCSGNEMEAFRSFPSGHASSAMATF